MLWKKQRGAAVLCVLSLWVLSLAGCRGASHGDEKLRAFFQGSNGKEEGTKWAVLVAGSNNWWNYRHQADVCHAHQILRENGFPDERVIVMRYDDLENNMDNPMPGVVINSKECIPQEKDAQGNWVLPNEKCNVNQGCAKDYFGASVSPENFLNVLKGDAEAAKRNCETMSKDPAVFGGCNGKVLNSTDKDHVFVAFFDHGGVHMIGMPPARKWGAMRYVTANQLLDAITFMDASAMYGEMILYIEACESGSMFNGLLPKNISVWAATAADPFHSSYASDCGTSFENQALPCLGDLFSVEWMRDVESHDMERETWKEDWKFAEKHTNLSQVCEYGDDSLAKDSIASYLEYPPCNCSSPSPALQAPSEQQQQQQQQQEEEEEEEEVPEGVVSSREAKMAFLLNAQAHQGLTSLNKEYLAEREEREFVDELMAKVLATAGLGISSVEEASAPQGLAHIHVPKLCHTKPAPPHWTRGAYDPEYFACLTGIIDAYQSICRPLTGYSMRYTKAFSDMCASGVSVEKVQAAFRAFCDRPVQAF